MKKLCLSSVLLFIGFLSHAQINEGTILLGGGLNFYNSTQKSYVGGAPSGTPPMKNTLVSIQPSAMKVIGKNLLWGVSLDFSYQAEPGTVDMHYNEYGIGTFLRKYKSLGSGFYLFDQSGLGSGFLATSGQVTPELFRFLHRNKKRNCLPGVLSRNRLRHQSEVAGEMFLSGLFYADYAHDMETDLVVNNPETETTVEKTNGFDFGSNLSTGLMGLTLGIHYVIGAK